MGLACSDAGNLSNWRPPLANAVDLVKNLIEQDLEPEGPDGVKMRVKHGVAPSRQVSQTRTCDMLESPRPSGKYVPLPRLEKSVTTQERVAVEHALARIGPGSATPVSRFGEEPVRPQENRRGLQLLCLGSEIGSGLITGQLSSHVWTSQSLRAGLEHGFRAPTPPMSHPLIGRASRI